ncbi:MAG: DNA polymerase/3'-5' exonuclease PolX [bacterium]|nr:DNA polymerase/3'-5' exonuclease PolX [bacterium]MDZ4284458.1 DNA polymerase/3'-5' exonuclease PolX [Patescibacteria group bacterium]
MQHLTNREIASRLREVAALYEMDDIAFKPRAYEKAALGIEALSEEAGEIFRSRGREGLEAIPGIGRGIAEHIEEMLTHGTFREYERLKKKVPVEVLALMAVEGVGPKMVKTLWQKLKVRTLADLERAARAGKVRKLSQFGVKSEEKILKGIEFLKKSGGRRVLGTMLPEIEQLERSVREFPEVHEAIVAGSVRRRKETIGDIDIVAVSKNPKRVMERFLALPEVAHVYASGETKTLVRLTNGLDADLRVVPSKSFGAALNYFTGSKAHNIALREMAVKKGWKLNEYGLYKSQKSKVKAQNHNVKVKSAEIQIAGKTEEDLYKTLGLRYIEPELREDTGEIEAARNNKLPKLIGYGDLKGDLQVQTDWTDGDDSIEEMARAAKEAGLEYIAITDHTRGLAMTGGLDEEKLLKQADEIQHINRKIQNTKYKIHVLTGAEGNIGKDGSLDIADEVLAKLDVVGAAVHSHFKLSRAEQTKRLIRAMENPHVDIIFHLTGRLINKREAIELDIEEVIRTAKRTGTILEIDASPERADIKDEYIKKCVEAGVKMVIDSDAHAVSHFAFLSFGIAQARRGWASKNNIINTLPIGQFLRRLKGY